MSTPLTLLLGGWMAAAPAAPASPAPAATAKAHLQHADELIDALQFDQALAELKQARQTEDTDRATLLQVLEMTGLVQVSLNQPAAADRTFHELLVLDPDHVAPKAWSPKIRTRFFEAASWLSKVHPLTAKVAPGLAPDGRVDRVSVKVDDEALHLAETVTVHLLAPDKRASAPLTAGEAQVPVPPAPTLRGWVSIHGKGQETLLTVGDPERPLVWVGTAKAAPLVRADDPSPTSEARFRPAAYGLMAGGAVGLGLSGLFGFWASSASSALSGAARNSSGQVTGLTQRDAFAKADEARRDQVLSATFGVLGVAALGGGAVLWFLGRPVSVAPMPNGLVVGGSLP
jgi:hypothetical protein